MSTNEFTTMALTAQAFQLRPQILEPVKMHRALNLRALRGLRIADLVENAPRVTSVPDRVERALTGADGTVYFVPQARIAQRSKATGAPHVFLAKSAGVVTLQVWFDLVRHPSVPSGAQPLPVDNYAVSLVPASGSPIAFTRCDDLPAGDQADTVVSRLYCEVVVDPNTVVPMLEALGTRLRVEADVHYTTQDGSSAPPPTQTPPIRRRIDTAAIPKATIRPAAAFRDLAAVRINPDVTKLIAASVVAGATPAQPEAPWRSHTARLSLGAADNSGVAACFPRDVMNNRAIYSQVTSGFGSEPWSDWVDSPNGQFLDSPIPDQFYILPDEYRLAFNAETGRPAMMVLLVPPKRAAGEQGPTSFGADYTLRTRFSIVPWVNPERRERLRAEITRQTGVPYPDLLVGGMREATCRLSSVFHDLGPTVVGGDTSVDARGFDLVLDCTSEFYTALTHLLVTEGLDAEVTVALVSDPDRPRTAKVGIELRLDRPATDVLSATLVPAAPADEESVPPPPTLRVSNPLPYAVTVARTVASLLVTDAELPSPIGAVRATAEPSSFTLPAADGAPSTLDIALTPAPTDQPAIYGSVGVSFAGIAVDIDPQQVLAAAYDTGTTGSVSSSVDVICYQLAHPEVIPATLTGLFGLEVELRRSDGAQPVTVFLTTDQPQLTAQVSFGLSDIAAGMKPEQPTFQWRRRNMSGSGTGEWSDWATITGRQLFVAPTGM
ncbi:MAG: hypothetical protein IPJ61_05000 [Tessaracoccus sp.]|uniref:hypothetical protein n=1 Tax=Tessaracoccus sp. TaxID=1971211 RepID=UPI001EC12FB2|nr:hypothetical protein [Tessaracoccus sp.]MBK7820433.1 hypothetical protein [Tessaracoccus sp.]